MVPFFSLLLPFLQVFPSQWLHHSFYFEIYAPTNLGSIPKRHIANSRNYIAHGGTSWLSVNFLVLKDLGWANYYFSGIWSYLNTVKISVCTKNYILESWYILGEIVPFGTGFPEVCLLKRFVVRLEKEGLSGHLAWSVLPLWIPL